MKSIIYEIELLIGGNMQIIFDLDGTLFQTRFCDINAINRLFDEFGLMRTEEQYITQNIGKKTEDFLSSILPPIININDASKRFRELEQNEVKENGILFPNVVEMLDNLFSKGHSLYICSNGSIEYIELVLQRTKISQYFCEIHSAKHYASKAEAVKNILNSNQSAIVIGDTFSDIEAAMSNYIPSIGVTYGYGNKDDISKATFTADNANDIINYISQIEVFYHITHKLIYRGKRIIGINGVDTSGKTVFTHKFSKYLDCIGIKNTILHIDDFHNPSEIRYQGKNEVEAYYNNAFNYDQVINEILKPLINNGYVDKNVLCLNLETDKYENNIHFDINSKTVLIIEGVLLFREPMLEYLEGKIFLHIDFDEVIKRATLRDVPQYGIDFLQKYINKYIPIQKLYLSEHTPEQISDIVINNNDYLNPTILSTIQ